jgi:hypothetical protein
MFWGRPDIKRQNINYVRHRQTNNPCEWVDTGTLSSLAKVNGFPAAENHKSKDSLLTVKEKNNMIMFLRLWVLPLS